MDAEARRSDPESAASVEPFPTAISEPQADAVPQPSATDDGQLAWSGARGEVLDWSDAAHLLDNGPPPGFAAEAYPDGGFGGVPASAAAIAGLEWQEYGVDEPWKNKRRHVGADLMVMPCAHRFHEACLAKWLSLSRLCPCCRHALPSEEDEKAKQGNQGLECRATGRSNRARQANVRLFGPEWDSGGEDDCE
ncbi:hypothetical protein EJB05_29502, partial [Eragrostis curvula]